jgi:RHS repeat-associated protein
LPAITSDLLWGASSSLPLLLDDGTHSYLYGPSSAPLAQIDDSTGAVQYLHADIIGSIRQITSASGAVVGVSEYHPYGNRTNHTGSADSAIGYSGNLTDASTGLVYARARDYDPSTGQFMSVDPEVDKTAQPYAYCANNPLLLSDPSGKSWWNPLTWSSQTWDTIGTVAAVVGVVAGSVALCASHSVYRRHRDSRGCDHS